MVSSVLKYFFRKDRLAEQTDCLKTFLVWCSLLESSNSFDSIKRYDLKPSYTLKISMLAVFIQNIFEIWWSRTIFVVSTGTSQESAKLALDLIHDVRMDYKSVYQKLSVLVARLFATWQWSEFSTTEDQWWDKIDLLINKGIMKHFGYRKWHILHFLNFGQKLKTVHLAYWT